MGRWMYRVPTSPVGTSSNRSSRTRTAPPGRIFPTDPGLALDFEDYEYRFAAKLVEVKGPNDTLMDRQTAWLAILRNAGIGVQILLACYMYRALFFLVVFACRR